MSLPVTPFSQHVEHAPALAPADSAPQSVGQPYQTASDRALQTDRHTPELRNGPTGTDDLRNPLSSVVIGMAFLFAAMAAVLILG